MLAPLTTLFLLAAQVQAPPGGQSVLPPPTLSGDSIVQRARAARDRNERLISAYRVRASQRMGVGVHAAARDRMLFRQEVAVDIAWRRDSVTTITVVGARQGVPLALNGDQIPDDLAGELGDLVIDPGSDYFEFLDAKGNGGTFLNPLSAGSDSVYSFARGATSTIGLGANRTIHLIALDVRARRPDFRFIDGTFWFDASSFNLVRAVFRPSRPFDLRRDATDAEGVPAFVDVRADTRFITVEYALVDERWWMPRFVAIDAVGRMGSWLESPFRFERTYEDYEIEGGTLPDSTSTFLPAGRNPAHRGDSVTSRLCHADSTTTGCNLVVKIPADTLALLTSTALGPPILVMGDLMSDEDVRRVTGIASTLPERSWEFTSRLPDGVGALLEHARFNRIEGLSLGVDARIDFGRFQSQVLGRIGLAEGTPRGEIVLERRGPRSRTSLAAYSRLVAANPENRPLGLVNSFLGFTAGRDDGEYYQSSGVAFSMANTTSRRWSGVITAERQRPVTVESRGSLPHLLGREEPFRPNFLADPATQYGAALTLRTQSTPSAQLTFGVQSEVRGETGDFTFGRGSIKAFAVITPAAPVAAALTLSAGTTRGDPPAQGMFILGGAGTLRGYDGGVIRGPAFWRARVEVGTSKRAARLIAFTDLGWAGARERFGRGTPLISAGVGASFLDGLVRIDLARALRAPTGWRVEFALDGLL